MTIQVRRLSAALGAEISGVQLDLPLDEATLEAVRQAWREHLVLLFRDQPLTHAQHIAFSRQFGALDDHAAIPNFRDADYPEILPVTNQFVSGRRQPVGRQWHSDLSTTLRPPRASMLRSEVVPPVGGDTMFASMYLAYESLSDKMKEAIDDLWAVHDMGVAKHSRQRDPAELAAARARNPPVAHPLVRVHPETGRKALYASEMTTTGIEGMSQEESAALLEYLFRHSVRPEFTWRHRWRAHDLICWDNRCAMHLALGDYDIEIPRRLYRTTLLGEPSGHLAKAT